MAAHIEAAQNSHTMVFFFLFLRFLVLFLCFSAHINNNYSRQTLFDISFTMQLTVTDRFHRSHGIPMEITRPAGAPWIVIEAGRRQGRRERQEAEKGMQLRPDWEKTPTDLLFWVCSSDRSQGYIGEIGTLTHIYNLQLPFNRCTYSANDLPPLSRSDHSQALLTPKHVSLV